MTSVEVHLDHYLEEDGRFSTASMEDPRMHRPIRHEISWELWARYLPGLHTDKTRGMEDLCIFCATRHWKFLSIFRGRSNRSRGPCSSSIRAAGGGLRDDCVQCETSTLSRGARKWLLTNHKSKESRIV